MPIKCVNIFKKVILAFQSIGWIAYLNFDCHIATGGLVLLVLCMIMVMIQF